MARKRVIEAPSLKSWEDVNDALRQIAEAQICLLYTSDAADEL